MKPFDLEAAKHGEEVLTVGGLPVKIIYYDRPGNFPIVALVDFSEKPLVYTDKGKLELGFDGNLDLRMAPKKHQIWARAYKLHSTETAYVTIQNRNIWSPDYIGHWIAPAVLVAEWEE